MEQGEVKELIPKATLDARVAALLGVKVRDVSRTTRLFLYEMVQALAKSGAVNLAGLGRLQVVRRKGLRRQFFPSRPARRVGGADPRKVVRGTKTTMVPVKAKYYVVFKKAKVLTDAIKANLKEK